MQTKNKMGINLRQTHFVLSALAKKKIKIFEFVSILNLINFYLSKIKTKAMVLSLENHLAKWNILKTLVPVHFIDFMHSMHDQQIQFLG